MINLKQLNPFTKYLSIVSLLFLCYGYLARILGINFFWESKSIGWGLLFVSFLFIISCIIKEKKRQNKKTIIEKIGFGIISLVLLVKLILLITLPLSDSYSVAKSYLKNNSEINSELGQISGFSIIPIGAIQKTADSSGETGSATINLTVKGHKKYKDVVVYLSKYPSKDWLVEGIE